MADMERDYESDSDCLYVAESISQNGIRQMKLTFFFDYHYGRSVFGDH